VRDACFRFNYIGSRVQNALKERGVIKFRFLQLRTKFALEGHYANFVIYLPQPLD